MFIFLWLTLCVGVIKISLRSVTLIFSVAYVLCMCNKNKPSVYDAKFLL